MMIKTFCDVCDHELIKNNDRDLRIHTNKMGENYEHICKHCADKILRLIDEIKDVPKCVCESCGKES